MKNDIISLAGDITFERKRLSESLKKLEYLLYDKEYKKCDPLYFQMDKLSQSLDRIGALTKSLVHEVGEQNSIKLSDFVPALIALIQDYAKKFNHSINVKYKNIDFNVDQDLILGFQPVLYKMLEAMLEYGIESEKERFARGKSKTVNFLIETRAAEDCQEFIFTCDGNGVIPPFAKEHGIEMAQIGLRAHFAGIPSQSSSWIFYFPYIGSFRAVRFSIGKQTVCIPFWAITNIYPADKINIQNVFTINQDLDLVAVENTKGIKKIYEVKAGMETVYIAVQDFELLNDVFMKPLHPLLSNGKKYLGVVINESLESELNLVLNPSYLVYKNKISSPLKIVDSGVDV